MDPEQSQNSEEAALAAPSDHEHAALSPSVAPGGASGSNDVAEIQSLVPADLDRLGTPEGAGRSIPGVRGQGPSFVFLAVVSIVSLASDIGTKLWAERHLDSLPGPLDIWAGHMDFILAKNRGGAWGLLQSTNENVRRPFFLLVSAAAIAFIVTLYRRLLPTQRALKWGLPLVLGGALGNVFDRIRYGHVIDFIDVHVTYKGVDHHWPTFNVADIAICVGVGLMAIDMFTSRRPKRPALAVVTHPVPDGPASVQTAAPPLEGATLPLGAIEGRAPEAASGAEQGLEARQPPALPADSVETKPAS